MLRFPETPEDLGGRVAGFLTPEDLVTLGLVSRTLRARHRSRVVL